MASSDFDPDMNVLKNVATLKKRGDFLRLRSKKRFSARFFTVQAGKSETSNGSPRVGYTVTTKVGNAVVRNRIKRRLRQIANPILSLKGLNGYDYVIIARRSVLHADFVHLKDEFSSALDHIHKNGAKGRG